MHIAVKAPYLTFVRTGAEVSLRVAKKPCIPAQSHTASSGDIVTYSQLLSRYQSFVDAAIEDYRNLYSHYRQGGGTNRFHDQCWNLLLNDAAEEACGLLNHPALDVEARERMWQDTKRISEGCLLVLDKALV